VNLGRISELFSSRDLKNAAVGTVVVFGGVFIAGFKFYAHSVGEARLSGVAAIA
jgi:hypothetical protein